MSTHNKDFYEEMTTIILHSSSNIIKYASYLLRFTIFLAELYTGLCELFDSRKLNCKGKKTIRLANNDNFEIIFNVYP